MKYLLGTGRYRLDPEFESLWVRNLQSVSVLPTTIVRLEVGDGDSYPFVNGVSVPGNLGHVGDLLNGTKKHEFCGWSASVMALAMIAYCDESDFLYKEQDCLAFGPWVEQMYADMGDGLMVFGRKMESAPFMLSAQSLFLVRHQFIPEFVKAYLMAGSDGHPDRLPETKFSNFERAYPNRIRRLSFGYDRERPLNYHDRVWYAQKFTPQELVDLKALKLI